MTTIVDDAVFVKDAGAESGFSRDFYTLDEAMKMAGMSWVKGMAPHIAYDPNVDYQYRVVRTSTHDGTLIFTQELFQRALFPLAYRQSHFKREAPPVGFAPEYTVGRIRRAAVYGLVNLPCGKYPGQRESVTIPVRVKWVPAKD